MRSIGIWFFLSCKRYIHKLSFLVILLLLPVVTAFVRGLERKEGTEIRIAVCVEGTEGGMAESRGDYAGGRGNDSGDRGTYAGGRDDYAGDRGTYAGGRDDYAGDRGTYAGGRDDYGGDRGNYAGGRDDYANGQSGQDFVAASEAGTDEAFTVPLEWILARDLAERSPGEGMFRFYLCDSEEQLREEVASRRAECGYVIGKDLREKLDENDYRRCIRVYSAPSTVTAELSAEVVFSALMARYDRELFQDYVEHGEAFLSLLGQKGQEELREESGAFYDAWMENGGTFRFVYGTVMVSDTEKPGKAGNGSQQDKAAADQVPDAPLFPARGIVAVYIFVAGLYSAAVSLADERKGLFLALPAASRIPCQLAAMAGPVVLAALSGLLALAGGSSLGQPVREIVAMAAYIAATTVFSWGLRMVCRREAVVCCLIPFFLIGSLLFCPVIVDVGRYVPALDGVGRLFLPWYYLRMF